MTYNSQNPVDYDDFIERGIFFLNHQENERALADFNESIKLLPQIHYNPEAYLNRARALENLGRFKEAILDFNNIIRTGLLPHIYHAYDNLGAIYMEMRDWTRAEQVFREGLQILRLAQPDFKRKLAFMYYNYAITLRNLGKLKDAIKSLDSAIQTGYSDVDFFLARAEINLNSGYPQAVLSDVEIILSLDQKNFFAYWLKGHAYIQLKEYKQALDAIDRFDRLGGAKTIANSELVKQKLAYLSRQAEEGAKIEQSEVSSATKIALVEELIEKHEFDAARVVLQTLKEPNDEHIRRLNRLYLADSMRGITGLLEEWIQENQPLLGEAKKLMIRDANSYLAVGYSKNINDAIINELKRRKALNNMKFIGLNLAGLHFADISCGNANFTGADLSNADFSRSNLDYTRFVGANMVQIKAVSASFFEAVFIGTNLTEAILENANLQSADLSGANLQNANLMGANLESSHLINANLHQTLFSNKTILPDGNFWTSASDLTKFTHPPKPRLPALDTSQAPNRFQPVAPKPSTKEFNHEDDTEYHDWQTFLELDQWDPESDNFVGRDDGS